MNMATRCYLPVMLRAVVSCFAWVVVLSQDIVVKPVVPKYCEQLCNETVGCCSYLYTASDLSCHIMPDQQVSKKAISRIDGEGNMICSNDIDMFSTNSHQNRSRKCQPQKKGKGNSKRLLMLPYVYRPPVQARQLFLHNNSIVDYPYLKQNTKIVGYISLTKNMLMCATYSKELFFVPLNSRNKTYVGKKMYLTGIAVDEVHQLVFMTSFNPYCVSMMTTEGLNWSKVVDLSYFPQNIVSDSKRSMIYVLCYKGGGLVGTSMILKFTYEGDIQNFTITGRKLYITTIDFERDVLYVLKDHSDIFKLSLSNQRRERVISLGFRARSFSVVGSTFYIFPNRFQGKLVVLSGNGSITKINTGFKAVSNTRIHLCEIE